MKKLILLILIISIQNLSFGQGRKFLRDKIIEWGSCKNVAMTLTGGDLALNGKNGFASQKIPTSMYNKLEELNEKNLLIDDVTLTENNNWIILWGNNGFYSYGSPTSLTKKLREWNNEGEVINSITFNDNGEWIVISDKKFSASSGKIVDWLKEGESKHGELWAACMTNDALVAVYSRGYKFLGKVPEKLKKKLTSTSINVYRLKFLSNGHYFFADKKGEYDFFM
jgi:hypothetical protein